MDEGGFKGWCSAHVLILLVFLLTTCSREEPRERGTMDGVKENGVTKIRLLPPKEGNPRNSEGDFIQLRTAASFSSIPTTMRAKGATTIRLIWRRGTLPMGGGAGPRRT